MPQQTSTTGSRAPFPRPVGDAIPRAGGHTPAPNTNSASRSARRLLLVAILAGALAACTTVAPWQRQYLARPHMAFDPSPLQDAARAHAHASREAANTRAATSGGGCGCY